MDRFTSPRALVFVLIVGLALFPACDILGSSEEGGGGGRIAFATSDGRLFTVKPDGSNLRQIVDTLARQPNWKPDGSRIAFSYNPDEDENDDADIYTIKPDGSDLRQVTANEEPNLSPVWKPDGSRIAFLSARKDAIYTISPDGSDRELVTDSLASGPLDWKPDGSQLVFGNLSVRTDGTGLMRFIRTELQVRRPVWKPDGSRIAFTTVSPFSLGNLYTVNPDGSDLRQVTEGQAGNGWPTWKPDGSRIAFTSRSLGISRRLYTINPDGSDLRTVVAVDSIRVATLDWGP